MRRVGFTLEFPRAARARAGAPWLANSLTDARYRQAGISFPRPERTGGPGPSCRRTVIVARILIAEDEDAIRSLIAGAAARNHPDVTIVLMTGYADQRERAHGLDARIHDVITKPFSLGAMRRAVYDALCTLPRRRH